MERVELSVHTNMSTLKGVSTVRGLIKKAKSYKMDAIAITDFKSVQAFPEVIDCVSAGIGNIKAIYGYEGISSKKGRVSILAKNDIGVKNLYRLVSYMNGGSFIEKIGLTNLILNAHRKETLVGSLGTDGDVYKAILNKEELGTIEERVCFYDYLAIDSNGDEEINKKIISLGEKFGKIVVAIGNVDYADEEHKLCKNILEYMNKEEISTASNHLKSTDETLEDVKYLGKELAYEVVVTNTNKIADMCEVCSPISKEKIKPVINGSDEDIKEIAYTRIEELYGKQVPAVVKERVDTELKYIIENGNSGIFMIVQKLVKKAIENGYRVDTRGTAASSLVVYLLGITDIDPFGVNSKTGVEIPFESFLGFEGKKELDFNLNVECEYVKQMEKHLEEICGEEHVFKSIWIRCITYKEANFAVNDYLKQNNIEKTDDEKDKLVDTLVRVKKDERLRPDNNLILPKESKVEEFLPKQYIIDGTDEEVMTTHFDYHTVRNNLSSITILPNGIVSKISKLEKITGIKVQEIKLDDEDTLGVFNGTNKEGINTFGILEFGSKLVVDMLDKVKVAKFSDLVKISSLYSGTDVWKDNVENLINTNVASFDEVIVDRDDVFMYLIKTGLSRDIAYEIMESVRSGRASKKAESWNKYVKVMKDYEVPNWFIESCEKIKYLFPKAHSLVHALNALGIAWYKVHYPVAYYAVCLEQEVDEFNVSIVLDECDRLEEIINELEAKIQKLTENEKNMYLVAKLLLEMEYRGIKLIKQKCDKIDKVHFDIENNNIRLRCN